MSENPCKTCTRVSDPVSCHAKGCPDWQEWFLARWQEIHNYYLKVKPKFDCQHTDDHGFCRLYSNESVVWKCKEDASCEGYVEGSIDDEM